MSNLCIKSYKNNITEININHEDIAKRIVEIYLTSKNRFKTLVVQGAEFKVSE